jgi:hypothetical protein
MNEKQRSRGVSIKPVVVHFQGKAFNPEWKITDCLLASMSLYMLEEVQLIMELKLGEVNHDRMRKWVKTMCVPENTYHRKTFPPQKEVDTTKAHF